MSTSDKVKASVKAKLDAITNQSRKTTLIWRPPRGQEAQIRIVPYQHGPDPFNEMYFHYDIGPQKSILCPRTAGVDEKCPICEYTQFLLQGEKNDKNYALYRRLKSRLRVYVPVLVRGQEDDGVKFWGIGKNTYTSIASFFIDPEYGDLSDPLKGRDLKVMATAPTPQFIYGQVQVRPAANASSLSQDVNLAKSLIQHCPSVLDAFPKMTYEEIKEALDAFVAEDAQGTTPPVEEPAAEVEDVDNVETMFEELMNKNK